LSARNFFEPVMEFPRCTHPQATGWVDHDVAGMRLGDQLAALLSIDLIIALELDDRSNGPGFNNQIVEIPRRGMVANLETQL